MATITRATAESIINRLDSNHNNVLSQHELSAANAALLDTNGRGYLGNAEAVDSLVRISARPDVAAALEASAAALPAIATAQREEDTEWHRTRSNSEAAQFPAGLSAALGIFGTSLAIGFLVGGPLGALLGFMLGLILGIGGGALLGITLPNIVAETSPAVHEARQDKRTAEAAFNRQMNDAFAIMRAPSTVTATIDAPRTGA